MAGKNEVSFEELVHKVTAMTPEALNEALDRLNANLPPRCRWAEAFARSFLMSSHAESDSDFDQLVDDGYERFELEGNNDPFVVGRMQAFRSTQS